MAFSSQSKAGGLAVELESVGYLHGYSGSKTPENIAQKAVQCLLLGGDAKT